MQFSEIIRGVIALGEQISATSDAAARRSLEDQTRALLVSLSAGKIYKLVTLMYLGRGDFGTAGFLNSYEQISNTFDKPERAIGQMLEKPFGHYLSQAISQLEEDGVDLDVGFDAFLQSPLASVDDGADVELMIGPWYCDKCGQLIERPQDGMLQWLTRIVDGRRVGRDLRIVHHKTASPIQSENGCYADQGEVHEQDGSILADDHLNRLLSHDGLVRLLSLVADGELPTSEVNKTIMRLFVPGYEQGMRYFQKAISTGLISPNLPDGYFSQGQLKTIVANISRFQC